MFKIVFLCALATVAFAKPSVYGEDLGLAREIHVPAAVSTSFRKDIIHKPEITTYTVPEVVGHKLVEEVAPIAPIVHEVAAPVVESYAAPLVKPIIHEPIVSTYSAPIVRESLVHENLGLRHGLRYAAPLSYSHNYHGGYSALPYSHAYHGGYSALPYSGHYRRGYSALPLTYASGW